METSEKVDKSKWGPGPWQSEPDRVEWRHLGFACLMRRQPESGHWCGYVAVPPGHPWHGRGYSGVFDPESCEYVVQPLPVDVHGGLTYADKCNGPICHVPQPGEPDDVWWLGFDCAHHRDLTPGHMAFAGPADVYRTADYVRAEVESLARQALEAAK